MKDYQGQITRSSVIPTVLDALQPSGAGGYEQKARWHVTFNDKTSKVGVGCPSLGMYFANAPGALFATANDLCAFVW